MRIDTERHTHLSECELNPVLRLKSYIGVEHLDGSFVRQVYLSLVAHRRYDFSFYAQPGVAYLETPLVNGGLVLILGANRAVDFRHIFRFEDIAGCFLGGSGGNGQP